MNKNLYTFILAIVLIQCSISTYAQIKFQKTFGGVNDDEGSDVQQTIDGGYILLGTTKSFSAGDKDIYLIKTNPYGDTLWTKAFGGSGTDISSKILQTSDHGYVFSGYSNSFSPDWDIFLIKADSVGNTIWVKRYGGNNLETASFVDQTRDGGFIISGRTASYGAGNNDIYLIKTNSNGDTVWTRTFGESVVEESFAARQTSDGGYIVAGITTSFGANIEIYSIKTDSSGNLMWSKAIGTNYSDDAASVIEADDGGYYFLGETQNNPGASDILLFRTDSIGNLLWSKTYGDTSVYDDIATAIQKTSDGNLIISGHTRGLGNHSNNDFYLIKTDTSGNILWSNTFGGYGEDIAYDVKETSDSGFIIIGQTNSYGSGLIDVYLIKTDAAGHSGCHEINPLTVIETPALNDISVNTRVSSGGNINSFVPLINHGGNINSLCISVGQEDIFSNNYFSIFPNPCSDFVHVNSNSPISKIAIYDLLGKELYMNNFSNSYTAEINIKDLPGGNYFLKIEGEARVIKPFTIIR